MTWQMVVDKLRARKNTPHRKLPLQSEVGSLDFDDFMAVTRYKMRRNLYPVWLNTSTISYHTFVDGFHTESNKVRFLLNAVLGKK